MGRKGIHFSPKTEFMKGQIPWNKGKYAIKQICQHCGKEFETTTFRIKNGRGKFCSKDCSNKAKIGNKLSLGRHHTKEAIQKMREAHLGKRAGMLGKKHSEESKKKISNALKDKIPWIKGKHHSEDTRLKLLGRRLSEQSRQKISEAKKGHIPWNKGLKGTPSPMKGKKTGKPAWNRGLHPSNETLKRLSESHKGQDHWTGRQHSKESIKKMSIGHKNNPTRYWLGKERPDIVESSRETLIRLYKSGSFPKQSNTVPERAIKEELIKRGYKEDVDFIHQGSLGKFIPDFYFPKEKIIIECDGDYWHANPKKHPYDPLTYINTKTGKSLHPDKQIKNIKDDAKKNYYYSKLDTGSWRTLRLWESDIKKDVKECVNKIEEMIKK